MPGGHLAAVRIGADAARQSSAEFLHVPGIVGEQHIPLECLGGCTGVVLEPVDRQGHPLRPEQEQLLAPQVPAGLIDGRPEPGVVQVKRLPPAADRDPGPLGRQPAQFPLQVPADGVGRGEFTLEHAVVHGPGPLDRQPRVVARQVGRLHGVAEARDLRGVAAVHEG